MLLYKGLTLTDAVIRLMGKCTSLGAPAQAFACLNMYLHHPHVCLGRNQLQRTDRPFAVADRLNPSVVGGDPSSPSGSRSGRVEDKWRELGTKNEHP